MYLYYLLFVGAYVITMLSTYLNKKYQTTAGTGLFSTSVYMVISGVVSALPPALVLIINGQNLKVTFFSVCFAFLTVMSAGISMIGTFKAYEKGQVAVVSVFSTIGSIVISCAWGIFFLEERLTIKQIIGIVLMISSVLVVILRRGVNVNKSVLWILLMISVTTGITSVLSKQHQVEIRYATVDVYSYSLLVGIIRAVVFGVFLLCYGQKLEKKLYSLWRGGDKIKLSGATIGYAIGASLISGSCYIVNLIIASVLPITIISTFGPALSILLSSLMAWVAYHEKLEKRQILGIVLCVMGIAIFV